MEATKRPWTVEGPKHEHYHASIMGADGHLIVNIGDGGNGRDVQLANADLIVRAVNTFDQAREALKRAQRALLLCEKCIPEKHYMNHGCYTQEHARMSIQEIGDVLTSMEAAYE